MSANSGQLGLVASLRPTAMAFRLKPAVAAFKHWPTTGKGCAGPAPSASQQRQSRPDDSATVNHQSEVIIMHAEVQGTSLTAKPDLYGSQEPFLGNRLEMSFVPISSYVLSYGFREG